MYRIANWLTRSTIAIVLCGFRGGAQPGGAERYRPLAAANGSPAVLIAESLAKDAKQTSGGGPLDRRTAMVRLYLDHHATEQALRLVLAVTAAPPADAATCQTYAGFLEELGRPQDALALWQRVLDLNPSMEEAYFRRTRLLLAKGAIPDALRAADAGLAAAPKSARLYLAKSELLEKQGAFYAARNVLRKAAASLDDSALLLRLAEMEDISGHDAARSYLRLAEVLEKDAQQPAGYAQALERGLDAALRDHDTQSELKLTAKLADIGRKPFSDLVSLETDDPAQRILVPGGLEALAFIARSKSNASPERFFVEYAKAVRLHTRRDVKAAAEYFETLRQYFELVAALEALGVRDHDKVTMRLSLRDKASQHQSEKILNLLGWKLRAGKNRVTLELAQAKRQETASALAIDEVGMQEALEAHRDFSFEMHDQPATLLLGSETWRKAFYPKEDSGGGFAVAMARDPRIAKVYIGLSAMDPSAVSALLGGADLKLLAEKHADQLYLFSSALAMHEAHAAVPGGPQAEPIWEKLAGASPARPAQFFRALLEKDDGRLLAFYATLAQLDLAHQRFFTRDASRTSKFYEVYSQSPESARDVTREALKSSFFEFLREVPLDAEGNVRFPGSPELWMVAKGQANSVSRTNKLLKKISKTAAPEEEDEILYRLARTRYKATQAHLSELDNFLAVVRIDQHRSAPLDEASALLLAEHFVRSQAAYPYFASLTALGQAEFESFFAMEAKLGTLSPVELNAVLGEFHALAKLLCLAQESGRLPDKQAADLFGELCRQFGRAASAADFTSASLDLLRALLQRLGAPGANPDDAIRTALLGQPSPAAFEVDGAAYETDWIQSRHTEYRHVCELQRVTPLAALYSLYDAARNLSAGQGSAADHLRVLETTNAALPMVEVPKALKESGKRLDNLAAWQPQKAARLIAKLREKTAKPKVDPKDVDKLCRDLLAALQPQVKVALTGIVYAYYFRPGDLLISEDPLFLRKHEFTALGAAQRPDLFQSAPDLEASSAASGSHLTGGFAGFAGVAGKVAARSGAGNAAMVTDAQIGALRATNWGAIGQDAPLLFGLRIRLAREWILRAAGDPALFSSLAEATLGALSLRRRADLLHGLRARDWKPVWQAVTLSDLYFLSESYLSRYQKDPWDSPVTRALRRWPEGGAAQLVRLGAHHPELNGCDHPHLMRLAPYEEYERLLLPTKMAERVTELKLYLIDYAGQVGIPAAALGAVAEPVALAVLRKLQMADMKDWRPIPQAFSNLDDRDLLAMLKGL